MTTPDNELLENYRTTGHEAMFTDLVKRHLGLVHSAALRITRQPALAQDISQTVFTKLARLRKPLPGDILLVTWLHRTTRSASIDLVRAESRRRAREETAASITMNEPSLTWEAISPVLDEVIDRLSPDDRQLVLCRYFNGESHGELARSLGLSEDAVRMRLNRALERVRSLLQKRGITTTASALASALPAYAISPVPAGLVSSVVSTAILPALLPTTLITIGIITMTKKTTIAATICLLTAVGSVAYIATRSSDPKHEGKNQTISDASPMTDAKDPATKAEVAPGLNSHVRRERPGSEYPELVEKFGQSRVRLAENVFSKIIKLSNMMGKMGEFAEANRKKEGREPFSEAGLELDAEQKGKIEALFVKYQADQMEKFRSKQSDLMKHRGEVMEEMLYSDAAKHGSISREEYKSALDRGEDVPSELPDMDELMNPESSLIADDAFLGEITPILSVDQLAKFEEFRAKQATNHAPEDGEQDKDDMRSDLENPTDLEQFDKQTGAACDALDGMLKIVESMESLKIE